MSRRMQAYVVPFVVFMLFLAVPGWVGPWLKSWSPLLSEHPKLLVWPVQTLSCAVLLIWYWREYDWGARLQPLLAVGAGVLSLAIWLAPAYLMPGAAPRVAGFNPTVVEGAPLLWWLTVIARFFRLVIVVPLVEEIFWRGFLMRYLINPEFDKVKMGAYGHISFWAVAGLFALGHDQADWVAAFIVGAVFNLVAVRSKSLVTCVLTHAVTNAFLGAYIMATQRWGYW